MTDEVGAGIKCSLELFVSAVERTSNLEIVCAEEVDGKDILVVENSNVDSGIEGHQCTVDLSEIFAVIKDCKSAQQFIDVINGARNPIICHGISRIVGYYSRMHNWNSSKLHELKDRAKGTYGATNPKVHQKERVGAIDAMSTASGN